MNTKMKKLTAVLAALVMVFAMTAALSEGSAFAFRNGVKFGMSVNEVRAAESGQGELDHEHEGLGFDELEYEHVTVDELPAELKYLFLGDRLVAIRVQYDRAGYDQVKAKLTAQFGDAAAVDLQLLGKGVFAVDDDGRLEVKAEAIVSGHLIIVLEQDEEDVNVTYVDLTAGYLQ